jgi:hypothetical protein
MPTKQRLRENGISVYLLRDFSMKGVSIVSIFLLELDRFKTFIRENHLNIESDDLDEIGRSNVSGKIRSYSSRYLFMKQDRGPSFPKLW